MSRETILLRIRKLLPIVGDVLRIQIGDLGNPELPSDIVIGRWRLLLNCVTCPGMLNAQAVYRIQEIEP